MGNSQTALGSEAANHDKWDRAGGLPGMKARNAARSAGGGCPTCYRCRPPSCPSCPSCPPTDVARECPKKPGPEPVAGELGPNPCETDLSKLKKKGKRISKMNKRRAAKGKAPIIPCEQYGVDLAGVNGEKCAGLMGNRPRTLKRLVKSNAAKITGSVGTTVAAGGVAAAGGLAGVTTAAGAATAAGAGLGTIGAAVSGTAAAAVGSAGLAAGSAGAMALGGATVAGGALLAGGAYHMATKNIFQDVYMCKTKGT